MKPTALALLFLSAAAFAALQVHAQAPSDPIYWCNISRAQVSGERDASLAQIEALKLTLRDRESQIETLTIALKKSVADLETARKTQE